MSRGLALPAVADPRTIRGHAGHVVFDDFPNMPSGAEIWQAATSRAAAGRIGRQRGADFEDYIEKHLFEPAVKNGLFVRVDRQNPKTKPAYSRRVGKGQPLFYTAGKSGVDWIALLAPGHGMAYVAIEAKSVASQSLSLTAIDQHQLIHLNDAARVEQGALLLVNFLNTGIYAVPWRFAPFKAHGPGHGIHIRDLAQGWRVESWQSLGDVLRWTR